MTYEAEPIMRILPEILPRLPENRRQFYQEVIERGMVALLERDKELREGYQKNLAEMLDCTTLRGFPAEGQLFLTAITGKRNITYCLGNIPPSYGGKEPIPKRFQIKH